ncbi:MAG: hypothetical protein DHS20C15_26250 [Planctomycetota bacterium]|nr:MAG: hypothetical protein DHS20C15_26250 [Planctomycetota bacterium]
MIRDLAESSADAFPDYDLCVVGSGPAGITLVRELAASGLRIALLESGRRRPTPAADALREVSSSGLPIKDYSRERVLGGTSSTWAGLSSPLDDIDLEARPWLAAARDGWPIPRAELEPCWRAASDHYRFAPYAEFESAAFDFLRERGDRALRWEQISEKVFRAASEAQHFGKEWGHVCEDNGPDLWLDASVLRLNAEPGTRRIASVTVRNSRGTDRELRARAFVLAAGGIENARLLLLSTDLCAAGLGNAHDQVGRGFMNHPKDNHGIVTLKEPLRELPAHFGCLHQGYAGYLGLRLRSERQREQQLLNSYVRFEPLFPWSDRQGVEAFVLLVKSSSGLFKRWKEKHEDDVVTLRDYSETGDDSDLQNQRKSLLGWLGVIGLVLRDIVPVTRYVLARLARKAPLVRRVRLRNFMEMEPHPDNRVTLSSTEVDAFGSPRAHVHHETTALDRRSLVALHAQLGEELEAQGFGSLHSELRALDDFPIQLDASHHLGTTAMGHDPQRSVVDPNLRVHDVPNLWCAGGSVFPTSGCANPTYTIVALSIRLAAHLESELKVRP